MNRLFYLLTVCLLAAGGKLTAQQQYTLQSPDGRLVVEIAVSDSIHYSVTHEGTLMLAPSPLSITLESGEKWGVAPRITGSRTQTVRETISAVVYKRSSIEDHYNQLLITFRGDYRIEFRAYDEGFAYRFISTRKKPFIVENEQAEFRFPADQMAYIPYVMLQRNSLEEQYFNSFENLYEHTLISEWNTRRLAFNPLLVAGEKGKKVCLAEADQLNYPGMFLYNGEGGSTIKARFAPVPKVVRQGGHNELQGLVRERESYIARFDKGCAFPWRIVAVSSDDSELADSDLVYKLATPTAAKADFSWVRPGKVAWDWWNNWNIYGVDFKAGINNATYRYYIDFAARHGIEYVILDEGWSVNKAADLMQIVPEIDLPGLVRYAAERNVGLILWAGYWALNRDIEGICKHYSEMGIKGFKVDFMDRDDQIMVDFHRRTAEIAARYKLLIDFHGTYKPTGLQRTYPNVINFEGVFGLEQMKWADNKTDQVGYEVTMPFIRMFAGPIDYTQGAMRNATKGNYRSVYSEPMSQGTRCRQLAQYVIFESPLNMLCDAPTNYMLSENLESTAFIAAIPTTWDETRVLNGKIGQYLTIARRKGDVWYVGGMTDWSARDLEIDLSFLKKGTYRVECFLDGPNAHRNARDYKKEEWSISGGEKKTLKLAPGGGFALIISE